MSGIHSEILAQCLQSTLEACTYRIEFPFPTMTIELCYDNCSLYREIFTEIEADQLFIAGIINDMDERIRYLPKVLLALLCLIDRDREVDLLDISRDTCQIYADLLVVAFAFTSQVIAEMLYRPGSMLQVAIENEVLVITYLAISLQQECCSIQVEVTAAIVFVGIPA